MGLRDLQCAPRNSSVLRPSCGAGVGIQSWSLGGGLREDHVCFQVSQCSWLLPHGARWPLAGSGPVGIREMIRPEVPWCSPLLCRPWAFTQVLVRASGLVSWGSPEMEGSATNGDARVAEGLAVRARPQGLGFPIRMLHSSGASHFSFLN